MRLPAPRQLCPHRHTTGGKAAPWVRGENEATEVVVLRNGQRQVKLRCRHCRNLVGPLPIDTVLEWMSDLGAPLIRDGNMDAYPPCCYQDCQADGVDWHHFAPRNTFGADADNWPVMPLCREHHVIWHQSMDGYQWHRKAVAS